MKRDLKFSYRVPVRFRDVDAMGHAHHSMPLVYSEEARAAYWRDVVGRPAVQDIDYVLAEVRVQFKQRVLYPGTLTVHTSVTHLGNASFTMGYELRDDDGAVLASGESVQVMFDYARGRSMPVPAQTRSRIEQYEGLSG